MFYIIFCNAHFEHYVRVRANTHIDIRGKTIILLKSDTVVHTRAESNDEFHGVNVIYSLN
jgi:hypothetical protein